MNKLNRSARAALSFLNELLNHLSYAFIGLVISPLIVANLGTDVFGAWKIIDKATTFLTLANFKPFGYLQLSLAKNISSDDFTYKQQLVGSAIAILILTLPIMLTLSYLVFTFRDIFMPVSIEISNQVDLALLLALFFTILSSFCWLPDYIVRGLNMHYMRFGVSGITVFITALLQYFVVAEGHTLPWFAALSYLPMLTIAIINCNIILKNVPWFKFVRPPAILVGLFFRENLWMLLVQLFRYVFSLADLMLIGFYFGTNTAAIYSLTKGLIMFLLTPANALVFATLSGIGDLVGRNELKVLRQFRSEQINFAVFLGFTVGMIVLFFNHPFVRLWVDEKHFAGETLTICFILASVTDILAKVEANYLDAFLKLKRQALCLGTAAITYLAIIVLCKPILGLNVIPIAQIIAQIILMVLYWSRFKDCLQSKPTNLARTVLRPSLIAIVLGYSASWIQLPIINNWLELFIQSSGIVVVSTIVGWFLILQKNDRKKLMIRLSNIFEYRRIKQ